MKLCLKKKQKKLKTIKNAKSAQTGFGKQSTSLAYTKHVGFQLRHCCQQSTKTFFFLVKNPYF